MKLFSIHRGPRRVVEPQRVRLVVVEDGADDFESRVVPDQGEETIVVAQTAGESPAALLHRVATRIAAVERSEKSIGRAVVLVGGEQGTQKGAARWLIARALLTHLQSNAGTELVLDALGAASEIRHELLSLVETLLEKVEHGSVPIRLQFRREATEPAPRSGVYPVVEELTEPAPALVGS